jgi:hypothetical protein
MRLVMFYNKYIILFLVAFPHLQLYAEVIVVGSLAHEKTVSLGETYSGQFVLRNTDSTDVDIKIYQTDYRFYANGENYYDKSGTQKRSNANWIRFSPQIFAMQGNTKRIIQYTVSVPHMGTTNRTSSPLLGSFWSLIMVEAIPADIIQKDRTRLELSTIMRYGVQIITNIGSSATKNMKFNNSKLLKENSNLVLQFDIENNGEQLLKPDVWVKIFNNKGEPVGNFAADAKRTFPKTSVRYNIKLKNITDGKYKALIIADCGEADLFGHQITLNII